MWTCEVSLFRDLIYTVPDTVPEQMKFYSDYRTALYEIIQLLPRDLMLLPSLSALCKGEGGKIYDLKRLVNLIIDVIERLRVSLSCSRQLPS